MSNFIFRNIQSKTKTFENADNNRKPYSIKTFPSQTLLNLQRRSTERSKKAIHKLHKHSSLSPISSWPSTLFFFRVFFIFMFNIQEGSIFILLRTEAQQRRKKKASHIIHSSLFYSEWIFNPGISLYFFCLSFRFI